MTVDPTISLGSTALETCQFLRFGLFMATMYPLRQARQNSRKELGPPPRHTRGSAIEEMRRRLSGDD
jgi:hypothetical protein